MTGITSTGLGSGLDIKTLVSSLVAAEQTPATSKLDTKEALLTTQISSYGNLKSAMATFQSSLSALKKLSTFQKLNATSSDTATVSATAFSNADSASYNLEVKQLAKSQTLATTAYSSATTAVGTGTLTLKFGTTSYVPDGSGNPTKIPNSFTQDSDQGVLTLHIDSSNNTLAGLSATINKANAGVTAVVVSDKSGSRLVLNSTSTGANNSMELSVDNASLSKLAFNATAHTMTQSVAAQDANLAINGLDITSASNTVNTAIKGLSFNLLQAQPGKIITVGVSQNNDDITTAITGFVKGFNDLVNIVNPLTSFDKITQKGGTLQGDATLRSAMWKLRSNLGSMVSGMNGSIKSLADIGISTQADGTLVLDTARLNSQLAANRSGVSGVFAVQGSSSNTNVVYSSSTSVTKAGQYAVNIIHPATQATLTGIALPGLTVGASGNDNFAIKVDGIQSGTITLSPKTYANYDDLATEMQTKINADSMLSASGASVGVAWNGTKMIVTSNSSGTSSKVDITADNTSLGLGVSSGTTGINATQSVLNGTTPPDLDLNSETGTFAIKVDGFQSGNIALTQQTYSSYDNLAAKMQNQINADSTLSASGVSVSVNYDATPGSEHFVIKSNRLGATSQVELTDNTTSTLGLSVGAGTVGADATKGALTGATTPTSTTVAIAQADDTFKIKVDGTQSGTIALSKKTYLSYDELATEMQTQINVDSALKTAGASVGVAWDSTNSRMVITSKNYGAASQLEITDNTTSLVNVGSGSSGVDVSGSIGGSTPTQGTLTGISPTSLTVGAGNNSFAINVDGIQSGSIALTQQTYATGADLATEMQTRINADSILKASGSSVGVSYDTTNNRMVIKSTRYGADSQVQITANSTTTLGLSVGIGVAGVGPTGKGQELTSTTGDSQGLKLIISDTVAGDKGTVDFSRGLMESLDSLMSGLLNSTTGAFTARTNGLQTNLTNIGTERTKLATRMAALQTSLLDRFNKMDALVGQMQATSNYLTQQFKSTTSTN